MFFCHLIFFRWFKIFLMFSGLFKPAHCAVCILGELAGGGSVALFVGSRNRWQMTHNIWHVTHYKWHVTSDTWHVTHDIFFSFFLFLFLYVLILVLISAQVERFSIFCMQDFFSSSKKKSLREWFPGGSLECNIPDLFVTRVITDCIA